MRVLALSHAASSFLSPHPLLTSHLSSPHLISNGIGIASHHKIHPTPGAVRRPFARLHPSSQHCAEKFAGKHIHKANMQATNQAGSQRASQPQPASASQPVSAARASLPASLPIRTYAKRSAEQQTSVGQPSAKASRVETICWVAAEAKPT